MASCLHLLLPLTVATHHRYMSGPDFQLQSSRAKLGRPCDMCKNYELEMQKEQERIKALDSQLSQSRQNFKMQKKTIEELESTLRTLGEENQGMVSTADEITQSLNTID